MNAFIRLVPVISLVLLLAQAAPTLAQTAIANPGDVLLRYAVKVGDQARYKMTMSGTTTIYVAEQTQQTVITNEMNLTQRVKSRDAGANVITYETKIDSGDMAINGVGSPLPMIGQVIETTMSDKGEMLAANGANPNLNNLQLVFPDKAVKVGDTWSVELPPNAQIPVPLTVKYTVLDFPVFRNRPCAKIESVITSGKGQGEIDGMSLEMSASGTIFFDPARGQVVSNKVGSDMKMVLKRILEGKPASIITRMQMSVHLDLQD